MRRVGLAAALDNQRALSSATFEGLGYCYSHNHTSRNRDSHVGECQMRSANTLVRSYMTRLAGRSAIVINQALSLLLTGGGESPVIRDD